MAKAIAFGDNLGAILVQIKPSISGGGPGKVLPIR
jgi:hypothetical protein